MKLGILLVAACIGIGYTAERRPKQAVYTTLYEPNNLNRQKINANSIKSQSPTVSFVPYSNIYPFYALWNNVGRPFSSRGSGTSSASGTVSNQISTIPGEEGGSPYNVQNSQVHLSRSPLVVPFATVAEGYRNLWNYDVNSLRPKIHHVSASASHDAADRNDNTDYWSTYKEMQNDAGHHKGFQRGQVESFPRQSENKNVFYTTQGFTRGNIESRPDFKQITRNAGQNYKVGFIRGAVESSNFAHDNRQQNRIIRYDAADTEPSSNKVICYFASWSYYRKGKGSFAPENVDPNLCTHVVYAFANLDKSKFAIKESDPMLDKDKGFYQRVTALKQRNGNLKVLLGLGGWSDSGDDKYSVLANSPANRRKFAKETVKFLMDRNFDGLSVDWHYPKCWQSQCDLGPDSDKAAFSELIKELQLAFKPHGLILSATLSGYKEVVDLAYDIPSLSQYLDLMNVMAYDYHGAWETKTGHLAPLFMGPPSFDPYPSYNVNYTMQYYVSKGADRSKLIVGVPMYGQTFHLSNPGDSSYGSEAIGPGIPGEFTQQPGMLAYYEICKRVKDKQWTTKYDRTGSWGPYAYKDDQWVGYDNSDFLTRKARYVKAQQLGGMFVWTMDLDDFNNECCMGSQPLLRTISKELLGISYDPNAVDCSPPVVPKPVIEITTIKPGQEPETTSRPTSYPQPSDQDVSVPENTCDNTWVYKPDTVDCLIYYQCSEGKVFKKTCPSGLHWNQYAHACDWPEYAKCMGSQPEQVTPQPMPITYPTTTRVTTTRPNTPQTIRPTRPPMTQPPQTTYWPAPVGQKCQTGDYSAGPSCDKYYVCVGGTKTIQSCGTGLHWNDGKKLCDWPNNANCQPSSDPSDSEHGTKRPIRLPKNCKEGEYFGSDEDCSVYFICNHGQPLQFTCQDGLYWNQQAKVCDWPQNAGCQLAQTVPTSAPIYTDPTSAPIYTDPTSAPIYTDPTTSGTLTPILIPNPTTARPVNTRPTTQLPTTTALMTSTTMGSEVVQPDPGSNTNDFMIVCYFTNWAWYRPGIGKYKPDDINANLCTHIVYGFAVLDYTELVMKPHDTWADFDNHFYEQVTAFKKRGVKVTLAIGGWNDSQGDKYSRLVNSPSARRKFITQAIEFLKKNNFDGLDLDWEYPKCWQVECDKGPASDKPNFATFVREIKEAFRPHGLLLSSAVSPSKVVMDQGYDVPTIAKYLDWIAVMTYDFHGQWDKKTGHVAPLYFHEEDDFAYYNANYSINYWISQGADRKKIVMGMPLYGQSFTLANPSENGLNAPSTGGGTAGEFTRAAGFLSYYEICKHVQKDGWTVVQDETGAMGPYAYKGNQWVSYDDANMIRKKSQLIRDLDLGGGMIWALDLDDFRNTCGQGSYPLLTTIKNVLGKPRIGGDDHDSSASTTDTVLTPTPGTKRPTTRPPPKTTKSTTRRPAPSTTSKIPSTKPTKKPTVKTTTSLPPTTAKRPVTTARSTTRRPPNKIVGTVETEDAIIVGEQESGTQPQKPLPQYPSFPFPAHFKPKEQEADCSSRPFKPHESDCNKYYMCLFGNYAVYQCAPGTYWNKDHCDWTCGSEQSEVISTTQSWQTTNAPTTKRPTQQTTTSTTMRPWTDWTPSPSPSTPSTTINWNPTTNKPSTSTSWEWKPPIITTTTINPVEVPDSEFMVVCYFTNWAWYRQGIGKYKPEDIDYNLCTHVAYGFAVLNPETLEIRTHDSWADVDNSFYTQVTDLKSKGKKVVIAIGGWNDSLGDKYSRLVKDAAARRKFIKGIIAFIQKYNFDGLDLDWEYPKCWQTDCKLGPGEDKANFATFVREIKEAFTPHGYLLSSAVSPSKTIIDEGYDVPIISQYLDWIAVMTYDYHGQWDKKTGHVAPMYNHEESDNFFFNSNYTINYWISKGADRKKLVMGMPMYGQSFTLTQASNNGLNAPSTGGGQAGEFTRAQGFLAYYEVCQNVKNKGWTVVQDETGAIGPYAYKGDQWVSFDDANMIRRKSEYIKEMGLGGGMIWALDLDDFRNVCECEKHPLLKTINRVLRNYPEADPKCNL